MAKRVALISVFLSLWSLVCSGESLRFRIGQSEVDPSYRTNGAVLQQLDTLLSSGREVAYVQVRAAASPDGPAAVNRRLARQRAASVVAALRAAHPSLPEDLFRIHVLEEDWSGVEAWLRRSGKPYSQEAIDIIRSSAPEDRKAHLQDLWVGEPWDYLMRSYFPRLRRADVTVVFADELQPAHAGGNDAVLTFAQSRSALDPSFAGNAAVLDGLSIPEGASVVLEAWASPEGKAAYNTVLAQRRAASVKAYLTQQLGIPEENIEIQVAGEDWEGFRAGVLSSYKGADLQDILSILDDLSLTPARRKLKLKALDGGRTWRTLVRDVMPGLRAVRIPRPDLSVSGGKPAPVHTDTEGQITASLDTSTSATILLPPPDSQTVVVSVPDSTVVVVVPLVDTTVAVIPVIPVVDTTAVVADGTGVAGTTVVATDSTRITPVVPEPATAHEVTYSRPVLGVTTNLAFDALTAVNLGVHFPVGRHWDLTADVFCPWWSSVEKQNTFQWAHADLGVRYYLRGAERETAEVLRGPFAAFTLGGGLYDVQYDGRGWQGEELAAKLRIGYGFRLSPSWRLDLFAGAGVVFTAVRPYQNVGGITSPHHLTDPADAFSRAYPIPDAGISLTYLIHSKPLSRTLWY